MAVSLVRRVIIIEDSYQAESVSKAIGGVGAAGGNWRIGIAGIVVLRDVAGRKIACAVIGLTTSRRDEERSSDKEGAGHEGREWRHLYAGKENEKKMPERRR